MDTLQELISNTVLTRDKNLETKRFHKMNFWYRNNETSPHRKANIVARFRVKSDQQKWFQRNIWSYLWYDTVKVYFLRHFSLYLKRADCIHLISNHFRCNQLIAPGDPRWPLEHVYSRHCSRPNIKIEHSADQTYA